MPTYAYKCPTCRSRRDVFKSIANLNREEPCETCQTPMERQLSAPRIVADYAGYNCPITGKWVEGRRAHEENLKRHGCRVLEAGETEQVSRNRKAEDEALDRAVEATAEQFVETLSSDKREALGVALESGLDVSIERS